MKTPSNHSRGFTLIELMVSIAIAAILMMVAVPSMTSFMRNSELTSFANTMLSSMNAARGEAMKRGSYAMVVPANGTSWDSGWVVFIDVNRSRAYEVATDIRISSQAAKPSYLTITGSGSAGATAPYIMFDASGYSKLTGTAGFGASTFEIKRNDVSGTPLLDQTRMLKIASTGRARICTPKTSSDATCDATTSTF